MTTRSASGIAADAPDILRRILETKQREIEAGRARADVRTLRARADAADTPRGFAAALQARHADGKASVIAEVKRASPSAGLIREDFRPAQIATQYQAGGATCLSVLTDVDYFQGHPDFLTEARAACTLPVLRKDFIIDPWQVWETRAMGADCMLLIVAALSPERLTQLHATGREAGLDMLIEVHDLEEFGLARSLAPGPDTVIGVNNRDLRTFTTDLATTEAVCEAAGRSALIVSESGIHSTADVERLASAGAAAFLVGEAFMRARDPGAALQSLFGTRLEPPNAA